MRKNLFLVVMTICACSISSAQIINLPTNSFPSEGNVGIGTFFPKSKLDVIGDIKARNLVITGTNDYNTEILAMGSVIVPGNSKRTFNFYHRPKSWSTIGLNSYAGLGITDDNDVQRFRYDMVSTHQSSILLSRKDGSEAIKLSEGNDFGDYIHMPHSNSRIVIGEYGNYLPGHNLIVRGGDAKFEESVFIDKNVGIGTNNSIHAGTNYKLSVKGKIRADEVKIFTSWADYVFDDAYELKPLVEVEAFIKENGHLPNVPSGQKIEAEGLNLGEISKIQQEKIEELTLYIIELSKELKELKTQVQSKIN